MTGKPDLKTTMQNEGIQVKRNMALCPFHPDRHPSMSIKNERFKCFACGETGDVIDLIMKLKGLSSFRDTLSYLGINGNRKRIKPDPKITRERELLKKYESFKDRYLNFLCNVLRRLDQAKLQARTVKAVESLSWHYHHEVLWEHHLEILLGKDEKAKLDIYTRIKYGT